MQRPLSDSDKERLDQLNAAVSTAIYARRDWLDSKMTEYAEMQVGEYAYDLESCRKVGRVSELYRFWRDRNDGVRDTALSIEYQFETSPNCFDNTSRQPFKIGSKKSAELMARERLMRLTKS